MQKNTWVGYALIILGVVLVLNNADLLNLNGQIVWSALFISLGFLSLSAYRRRDHGKGLLVAGIVLIIAGTLFLIDALFGLPAEMIGTLTLWGISSFFIVLHFHKNEPWWPVIPGGIFFVLGFITLLDAFNIISDGRLWFVLMLGFAFIFWYLYLIRTESNRLEWAGLPAMGLTILSFYILSVTWESRLADMLFPVSVILLGAYMVISNLRRSS